VERTTRSIALAITVIALSAAACGSSASPPPPASAAPAPSVASAAPSASAAPPASAAPSANASPSQAVSAELRWSYVGTVPEGWSEEDGTFSRSENAYVDIMTDRSVMAADCSLGPQAGIGRTAKDIVGALSRRQGLATAREGTIAIGGLPGHEIDLGIAADWKGSCDWWDDPKAPVVPLVGTFDEKNQWLYTAVTKGERYRYVVLDVPGGRNVVIAITVVAPERFQDVIEPAMDIVKGLRFSVPE
jgi:hypothetical protein